MSMDFQLLIANALNDWLQMLSHYHNQSNMENLERICINTFWTLMTESMLLAFLVQLNAKRFWMGQQKITGSSQ